ncbi:MAG: hypothetical protein Q8S73_09700 [Deltaproteobacteria bacterium]|nr:hypothetical protein [Myxococcales bacterium]MDP3214367.1 hypothetical protein [Deltaproteobacteria bacterium]
MHHHLRLALFMSVTALASSARALPETGGTMPTFAVDAIDGTRHTQADLRGHWSVALVMTDKDVKDDLAAWWGRLETSVPGRARMYTFAALSIFPLVPTALLIDQARGSTPRPLWSSVWFSRDGSFAHSLGLPEDELPWVVVIHPDGRVVDTLHERVSAQGLSRILAALPPP